MIYMLEFVGLLAVAVSLAASPVLVKVLERFFPQLEEEGQAPVHYGLRDAISSDRAEMRDEIRRVTNLLETKSLDIRPSSNAAGHTFH